MPCVPLYNTSRRPFIGSGPSTSLRVISGIPVTKKVENLDFQLLIKELWTTFTFIIRKNSGNKYNLPQNIKGQKTTNTCPNFAIYVILMSDKCVNGTNYGIPSLTVIFMKPIVVWREASVTSSVNVYSPTSKFFTARNGVFNPCE